MEIITSKAAISPVVHKAIDTYRAGSLKAFVKMLDKTVLHRKVKFPILEYAAAELYKGIPEEEQLTVTDSIIDCRQTGSYVIAGYMLQLRLAAHFDECFAKAIDYIIQGDEWYVCDIIGERVIGHGLLVYPIKAIPALKIMAAHDNKWIVRAVGVATHYAVKKGLKKQYADEMYGLLLQLAGTTEFHTKKGVGWAAKTIAKFHPDIIEQHKAALEIDDIKQWFKTKVKIGLGRTGKYAHRHTS